MLHIQLRTCHLVITQLFLEQKMVTAIILNSISRNIFINWPLIQFILFQPLVEKLVLRCQEIFKTKIQSLNSTISRLISYLITKATDKSESDFLLLQQDLVLNYFQQEELLFLLIIRGIFLGQLIRRVSLLVLLIGLLLIYIFHILILQLLELE